MFSNRHAESRQKAQRLIKEGSVLVDGKTLTKASEDIDESTEHMVVILSEERYVGRGGLKLAGALDAFGLDVAGLTALDVGASTGGFTDCLLQRGAAHVIAVDAGEGQLAEKLQNDGRVLSMERTNARELTREMIGGKTVDLIVMDVSFISATYIIPAVYNVLADNAHFVCLVKPQFEVGRAAVGKGGIVKDARAREAALASVVEFAERIGFVSHGAILSPIKGGDGNVEYLVHFQKKDLNFGRHWYEDRYHSQRNKG